MNKHDLTVMKCRLACHSKCLLWILHKAPEIPFFNPSLGDLALLTGMDIKTARKAVRKLEDQGIISVTREKSAPLTYTVKYEAMELLPKVEGL